MTGEDPYERAAATWVARRLGIPSDSIGHVDFSFRDGGMISEVTWEGGEMILTFRRGNREDSLTFEGVTPAGFIRECVEILGEGSS